MNYIIIYLEIEHLLNFLTQEEKGDFLDLLIAYGKNQEYPKTENKKLLNVFNFMKGRLDTQFEKARIKAEIAKKNGANGGRPPKDKKPSKNPLKPKKTQSDLEITELVKGLQFILEAKLNKKINTNSWKEPIRLLVEKDLAQRPNAIEDVKRAIQEVGNRFGEQYFPVIQSGGSLREKFSKIENAMRKPQTKGESTIANIMEDF
jgi:hypothetical protein